MENKTTSTSVLTPFDDTDVTTWHLPKGAIARLGRGQIGRMTFSPDGTQLAVSTRIGCWLYDLDTMTHRALWGTERGMVADVSFSDDGQWVATSDWDCVVKIWNTQDLKCVAEIGVSENSGVLRVSVSNLTFLPDGEHLVIYYTDVFPDQTPRLYERQCAVYAWRIDTENPITNHTLHSKQERGEVSPTALSPDGSLFAYTTDANITTVICMKTGEQIAELHDDYTEESVEGCYRHAFSLCGRYLAACNKGNKVHVWNIYNGTVEMEPTTYGENHFIRFGIPFYTSNGNLRVAGIGGIEVVLWDAMHQATIDTFESWNPSYSACFSADGKRFAVANGRGELHIWTQGMPSTLEPLPVHHQNVNPVNFSNDGHRLVSNHKTRSAVCVWNVKQRQVEHTFHFRSRNPISGRIVLSNSLELLATTEESEKSIKVLNLVSNTEVAEIPENPARVRNMVFSPTGKYLVTTGLRIPIKVWNVTSGTQIAELTRNPSSHVSKIGFSPTGEYFVIIYGDSVTVWNTQQWEKHFQAPLTTQKHPGWKLDFDSNGKLFFTRPPRSATIVWDFKRGEQTGSLDIERCIDTSLYKGNLKDLQRAED
ncbi:WD40 repeat domain-containing protein [Candidatus Poribacteria bacterium]|nr:WD40 repeat domain-containing protein [Candidatus Poribacteria bacterium]